MCWNQEVSIAFAVFEVSCLLLMWLIPRTRQVAKYFTFGGLTVIVVETSEAFIWSHPEPIASFFRNSDQCHPLNHAMTWVAFAAVNLQPFGLMILAARTEDGKPHPQPEALRILKLATILYTIFIAGHAFVPTTTRVIHGSGNFSFDTMPQSLASGLIVCSYDGTPSGHLMWASTASDYNDINPGGYTYLSLWIFALFLFNDKREAFCLALFMIQWFAFFFVWSAGEAGSTWCWTGFEVFSFYLIYPLLKSKLGWATVTTWKGLIARNPPGAVTANSVLPIAVYNLERQIV